MQTLLRSLIGLFAVVGIARAEVISCDSYYPEPEDPLHTILVAEVVQNQDGSIGALKCYEVIGMDTVADCPVSDGICCPCNVSRDFTPECLVEVVYTESSTKGRCLATYPGPYYGLGDSAQAFVEATPVVKRSHRRHRRR